MIMLTKDISVVLLQIIHDLISDVIKASLWLWNIKYDLQW